MTCEAVREELVAYHDGELSVQEHANIAAHLATCAACAQEEAQFVEVGHLLTSMERIAPSPNFASSFWERLEQEQARDAITSPSRPLAQENAFGRWWRELRETLTAWQIAPALAAAASALVFFGYLMTSPSKPPSPTKAPQEKPQTLTSSPDVPAGVAEKLDFFVNYRVITDLERFSHFEEIAAVELPAAPDVEVAQEDALPPDLLQNPNFFTHYPMLKRMEQLQSLEAVLDTSDGEAAQNQG